MDTPRQFGTETSTAPDTVEILRSAARLGTMPTLLALTGLPSALIVVGDGFPALADKGLIIGGWLAWASLLYLAADRYARLVVGISTLAAFIGLIEVGFIAQFGGSIDANSLSLLAETNAAELGDLLPSLLARLGMPIVLVTVLAAFAWRNLPSPRPLTAARKRIVAYLAISLTSILTIGHVTQAAGDLRIEGQPFPDPISGPSLALRNSYPVGIPWVINDFFKERLALKDAFNRIQKFRFGAAANKMPHIRRVYILVIGETARADRLGINGYRRNTTPKLSARSDIVSFPRMYSEYTFSRLAVPALITRGRTHATSTVAEASIVTAFKEAGFRTAWISLQAPVGFHESPISIHAYEADRVLFLNPVDYRRHGKHDTAALPMLRSVIHQDERDVFIVLHTLGSHFKYTDRYPANQAKFLPDRNINGTLDLFDLKEKIELSNAYDNTILMLDSTLDGAISVLTEQTAAATWLFYASDHGEALFDDCKNQSGHGPTSFHTQSVASIFWASPTYKRDHPDIVANLRLNRDRRLSTNMGFETLGELGGLSIPANRKNHSIAGKVVADLPEAVAAENYLVQSCGRG